MWGNSANQHHTALASLARQVPTIGPDTAVNHAIELFRQDASLLALPVVSEDRLYGIMSRRELFYSHLAKPFARELFGRKPVKTLLEGAPLVLPGEMDITTALHSLMLSDPQLTNDCFGVTIPGRTPHIAAVADLMMAISRSQAELLETLNRLSSRIRSEVDRARQIQLALLPVTPLRHGGVSVAAGLMHSTEISGDFYDVFILDDNRLGLLVADVTGHGVQAGLVTTAAKAGLTTLLDAGVQTPARLLDGINRAIRATASGNLLMTAVIAILDRINETATLCSAGHPGPCHFSATTGRWQEIVLDPGFPLGFDVNAVYRETVMPFKAGDCLLLFSDGIQEAENIQGEQFGERRLMALLRQTVADDPALLRDALVHAARTFRGHDHFDDDVTVVVALREA